MGIEKGSNGGGKMRFVFLVEGSDLIHRLPEYLSTQVYIYISLESDGCY